MEELKAKDLHELPAVAKGIVAAAGEQPIILFYGEMGTGKTTLIKSICKELGSRDVVSSPTFSLVNEYIGSKGSIYHFDFYRLKSEEEALDMGYEEYFYSGAFCLIEWPEKIPSLLPENYVSIHIQLEEDYSRTYRIDIHRAS